MTGNDLIVAAPWIIFGAGLSTVWIRLLRARQASRHQPRTGSLTFPGSGRLRRSRAQAVRPDDVPAAPRRAPERRETVGPPQHAGRTIL